MMSVPNRYILFIMGTLVTMTASGCFLFGGSKEDESLEDAIAAAAELREGQLAVEEALFRADMAIEEERLDTAVIEFNRAIRVDSSQVGIYFELAQLHQQIAARYREDGELEAAIQENSRGLRVLENLMSYQKRNPEVANETPVPSDMSDMSADGTEETIPEETPPDEEATEPLR